MSCQNVVISLFLRFPVFLVFGLLYLILYVLRVVCFCVFFLIGYIATFTKPPGVKGDIRFLWKLFVFPFYSPLWTYPRLAVGAVTSITWFLDEDTTLEKLSVLAMTYLGMAFWNFKRPANWNAKMCVFDLVLSTVFLTVFALQYSEKTTLAIFGCLLWFALYLLAAVNSWGILLYQIHLHVDEYLWEITPKIHHHNVIDTKISVHAN